MDGGNILRTRKGRCEMAALRMAELRKAHPLWFASGNAEFFGDLEYRILHSKQGNPYLVRRTNQWSAMFGREKTQCWSINPIKGQISLFFVSV